MKKCEVEGCESNAEVVKVKGREYVRGKCSKHRKEKDSILEADNIIKYERERALEGARREAKKFLDNRNEVEEAWVRGDVGRLMKMKEEALDVGEFKSIEEYEEKYGTNREFQRIRSRGEQERILKEWERVKA